MRNWGDTWRNSDWKETLTTDKHNSPKEAGDTGWFVSLLQREKAEAPMKATESEMKTDTKPEQPKKAHDSTE